MSFRQFCLDGFVRHNQKKYDLDFTWYIGTVEVSIPVPIPVMKRATMSCGTL